MKKYVAISNNHKNIEKSFANTEARGDVLKLWKGLTKEVNDFTLDNIEEERYISLIPTLNL